MSPRPASPRTWRRSAGGHRHGHDLWHGGCLFAVGGAHPRTANRRTDRVHRSVVEMCVTPPLRGKRLELMWLHNCPGYTSTGGPWITPEMAMQQISGRRHEWRAESVSRASAAPEVDPRGDMLFPMVTSKPACGENPSSPVAPTTGATSPCWRVPAEGVIAKDQVIGLDREGWMRRAGSRGLRRRANGPSTVSATRRWAHTDATEPVGDDWAWSATR